MCMQNEWIALAQLQVFLNAPTIRARLTAHVTKYGLHLRMGHFSRRSAWRCGLSVSLLLATNRLMATVIDLDAATRGSLARARCTSGQSISSPVCARRG